MASNSQEDGRPPSWKWQDRMIHAQIRASVGWLTLDDTGGAEYVGRVNTCPPNHTTQFNAWACNRVESARQTITHVQLMGDGRSVGAGRFVESSKKEEIHRMLVRRSIVGGSGVRWL